MKSKSNNTNRDIAISHYENFLKTMGFKRTDGAIFGLLALGKESLSSEEIGKSLSLSQGAVSQGLKSLSHWGAVVSHYSSERRVHLHTANIDSLAIVATIFQKREQGAINAFRRANESARTRFLSEGDSTESERIQRIESYITTCEFADVIMEFAMLLGRMGMGQKQYAKIIRALPKALSAVIQGGKILTGVKDQIVGRFREVTEWR